MINKPIIEESSRISVLISSVFTIKKRISGSKAAIPSLVIQKGNLEFKYSISREALFIPSIKNVLPDLYEYGIVYLYFISPLAIFKALSYNSFSSNIVILTSFLL